MSWLEWGTWVAGGLLVAAAGLWLLNSFVIRTYFRLISRMHIEETPEDAVQTYPMT